MNALIIILICGFLAIQGIALLIAGRVRKHLGVRYSSFVYLFVAGVAALYWIDVLRRRQAIFSDPFFYFWLAVLLSQILLFFTQKTNSATDDDRALSNRRRLDEAP